MRLMIEVSDKTHKMFVVLCTLVLSARRPQVQPVDGITCEICKALVSQIEKLLADKQTEEEIASYVAQACTVFQEPLASSCTQIAKNYIPLILQLIEKGLEESDICQKIGFCDSISIRKHMQIKNIDNGVACDMCQKVIAYVEQLLKDQTVESEIAALVAQLCQTFPAPYSSLCDAVVKQYVPLIIQWIESGIESIDICSKIGLCSVQKKARISTIPRMPFKADTKGCEICKQVVEYIETLMKDSKSEQEIVKLCEIFCQAAPAPYDQLCKTLVEQFIPIIIYWIEAGIEALDICTKIGLCTETARIPKAYTVKTTGCEMCTSAVNYIEELLKDHKSEEEIASLLAAFCQLAPAPYATLCDTLCKQFIPVILYWIEQGIEALDICTKIGLCSVHANVPRPKMPFQVSATGCEVCTQLITYVENLLKDSKSEQEIIKLCEIFCSAAPAPYDQVCKTLVEQFIPVIIYWIEAGIEALDICTKIGLCSTPKVARIGATVKDALITCEQCKQFIKWAGDQLENVSVDALWKLINEECPKIPALKNFCDSITEELVRTYVDLIISQVQPQKACEWVKLC